MTFEMTRIKQRLADLENNQSHLLSYNWSFTTSKNLTMIAILELEEIVKKNTGKDHPDLYQYSTHLS